MDALHGLAASPGLAAAHGQRPWGALASPGAAERSYLIAALSLISALPFLLGSQPASVKEAAVIASDGDVAKQLVLALLYASFGVLVLWRAGMGAIKALGWPVLLLLALCAASALWSDLPVLALRRFAALAGTVLVGLYLGLRCDVGELLGVLARAVGIVLAASFILALVEPSLGMDGEGRFRGVFDHKNSMGIFAALGLLVLAARLPHAGSWPAKVVHGTSLAGCALALVVADSAASLPAAVLGLGLLFALRRQRPGNRWAAFAILAVACLGALFLPLAVQEAGPLAEAIGRDTDFSGRDRVWEFSLELFERNPWLGYGYGTFWQGPAGALFLRWSGFAAPHAHNGYLQLALDSGAVAVAAFLVAVGVLLFRLTSRLALKPRPEGVSWLVAFMALYLISGAAEVHVWTHNDLLTVLFIYVVVRCNLWQARGGGTLGRGYA
jgi:exopolysaccharide production protein ExoQ